MSRFNPLERLLDTLTFIPRAISSIPRKIVEYYEEKERNRKLEEVRLATPPSYDDGVTEEEFEHIVLKAKKGIPRIKTASIRGFVINIKVKSQSGINIWEATIDFNDFGHLTGWYTIVSGNNDSSIPEAFARDVAEGIRLCKEENGHS